MILFAATTGLRPAEWIGLEKRDVDREERVVYVRRSFTHCELKHPKTEASMRAVSEAVTSTSTISGRSSGGLPRRPRGIDPVRRVTICGTRPRRSRIVPASQPSISPAKAALA